MLADEFMARCFGWRARLLIWKEATTSSDSTPPRRWGIDRWIGVCGRDPGDCLSRKAHLKKSRASAWPERLCASSSRSLGIAGRSERVLRLRVLLFRFFAPASPGSCG
jgi:hypothetical protein